MIHEWVPIIIRLPDSYHVDISVFQGQSVPLDIAIADSWSFLIPTPINNVLQSIKFTETMISINHQVLLSKFLKVSGCSNLRWFILHYCLFLHLLLRRHWLPLLLGFLLRKDLLFLNLRLSQLLEVIIFLPIWIDFRRLLRQLLLLNIGSGDWLLVLLDVHVFLGFPISLHLIL